MQANKIKYINSYLKSNNNKIIEDNKKEILKILQRKLYILSKWINNVALK